MSSSSKWVALRGLGRLGREPAQIRWPSRRQRPEVGEVVCEYVAIGARAVGHEAGAGGHLGVGIPFRIASAVETDGGPHDPVEEVEANEPSVLQAAADGEVVPGRA